MAQRRNIYWVLATQTILVGINLLLVCVFSEDLLTLRKMLSLASTIKTDKKQK